MYFCFSFHLQQDVHENLRPMYLSMTRYVALKVVSLIGKSSRSPLKSLDPNAFPLGNQKKVSLRFSLIFLSRQPDALRRKTKISVKHSIIVLKTVKISFVIKNLSYRQLLSVRLGLWPSEFRASEIVAIEARRHTFLGNFLKQESSKVRCVVFYTVGYPLKPEKFLMIMICYFL